VIKYWIDSFRIKTLAAVLIPIFSSYILLPKSDLTTLIQIIFCAITLQIISNLANDLGDFKRLIDTDNRLGPKRPLQLGYLSQKTVFFVLCIFICLTLGIGSILVLKGGVVILAIGCLSILFALIYSLGNTPLSTIALGEFVAFLFFGPVATFGTSWLLNKNYTFEIFSLGVSSGFWSSSLMLANNLRDLRTDKAANKITVAVIFGKACSSLTLFFLLFLAITIPFILSCLGYIPITLVAVFLIYPIIIKAYNQVLREDTAPLALLTVSKGMWLYLLILICTAIFIKLRFFLSST
jgi:1,4-dihydroxy-2-naphthoate polyprenyltransferase